MPDLILLDLLLPTVDGLEVCRRLKADSRTQHIPVLMLTAKSEETDVVTGLELGAEDYVTKPFSRRPVARVKAVLRRRTKESSDDEAAVTVHDLVIHPGWHEVLLAGKPIDLTFTEFRLLHFLAQAGLGFHARPNRGCRQGRGLSRHRCSVDVQVAGLRKKLGTYGEYIETVRGIGYRFKG